MKSLVRWQPFQELSSLQQEMNRRFDNFFGRSSPPLLDEDLGAWGFGPPMDVYEDGEKRLRLRSWRVDARDAKTGWRKAKTD